jgi:hypothetical protein
MSAQDPGAQEDSRKKADAIVRHAIEVMGGDAWATLNTATATVTFTSGKLPPQQMIWNDDWSASLINFRRQRKAEDGSTTETSNEGKVSGGASQGSPSQPAHYDLSRLAMGYPAAALRIGLSRRTCRFDLLPSNPQIPQDQAGAIEMMCAAPGYPNGRTRILWWFSQDGLPQKVQLQYNTPIRYMTHDVTVQYLSFNTIQGLTVPVSEDVIDVARTVHFNFAATAFSTAQSSATSSSQ